MAQGEHNGLLSAIEDFGFQVGDEVAKTIAQKKAAKHIVQEILLQNRVARSVVAPVNSKASESGCSMGGGVSCESQNPSTSAQNVGSLFSL